MDTSIILSLLKPDVLLYCCIGTVFGILVGAIPGLNGAVGISLLLPITYVLPPEVGLIMLGGIYMGSLYGGSITAILLNIPGTVVASCTAWEGYPMAQQGRAREALYYSAFSSTFGGLIGVLALIFFTPPLARFGLKFGPPEMFFLSLIGLTAVSCLGAKNLFKSVLSVCLGLFITTIGYDLIDGAKRFTFGIRNLNAGIGVVIVVIGVYCFAEVYINIGKNKAAGQINSVGEKIARLFVWKNIFKHYPVLLKSSLLGMIFGILPGIGASLPTFMAYAEAKRTSKSPETFGHGNVEGIIAAESANNAVCGGSMVPLLGLGVPGSATAAIIGGALSVHGIMAGPDLFVKRPDVAWIFLYGMLFTILAMYLVGTYGVGYFSYILKVNIRYLMPVIFVFSMFGAYSISNSVFDIYVVAIFAALGVLFRKCKIPLPPLIIGVVLGPLLERDFRRSLQLANASGQSFVGFILSKPFSIALLAIFVVLSLLFLNVSRKQRKK